MLAYGGVLWLWHIPAMYDRAQGNAFVHVIEHACFFGVGLLYWWHVLSPIRSRRRLSGLGSVGYMTGGKLLVGLLGIALAFAPSVIYPFLRAQSPTTGASTPLEG